MRQFYECSKTDRRRLGLIYDIKIKKPKRENPLIKQNRSVHFWSVVMC